jgi:hypothetical protein
MELRITALDILEALNDAGQDELLLLQKILTIRVQYPGHKIQLHAPEKADNELIHCSFCGKSQEEVEKIIAGLNSYICNECIGICDEIIAESKAEADMQKQAKQKAEAARQKKKRRRPSSSAKASD